MTTETKTLGPQAAKLITGLYESGKSIFVLDDASNLTGLTGQPLQNLVQRLSKKGILTRLRSGLYTIVPFEFGQTREFMPNPYLVARNIAQQKLAGENTGYYISHASAMDLHQMVTQPQLVVYVTTKRQIKLKPNILGTEFRFITSQDKHFFGQKKMWIDKSEIIYVSNLEKTVLDGLKMPEHCGGITEVAKGFWIKRDKIKISKLIDYAEKMNIGAVYRRLGFLLETYNVGANDEIEQLQRKLTKTYTALDPTLPIEGRHMARWRLYLNIDPEELLSVIRT
jgi:predicted transcriptional regulator of viral defense system